MAAIERLVGIASLGKLFGTDAAEHAIELLGERKHERKRHLGAGTIDAPADGEHAHAFGRAGGLIDIARQRAEFLHHLEVGVGRKLLRSDFEPLDDERAASRQGREQLLLRRHDACLRRKQRANALAHARHIAGEIRLVVGEEVCKGGVALG